MVPWGPGPLGIAKEKMAAEGKFGVKYRNGSEPFWGEPLIKLYWSYPHHYTTLQSHT